MTITDIQIRFAENPDDEIQSIIQEMQLIPLARALSQLSTELPKELKNMLGAMLQTVNEIFSTELPALDNNPEITLRKISREFNLSRLLRERAMFRMYRLIRQTDNDGVPLYMYQRNPHTGTPFSTQNDFINWFTAEAHISRGFVYQRLAAIERLLIIGYELEEAFHLLAQKPFVVSETLRLLEKSSVLKWNGDIVNIDPDKAVSIAKRINPDRGDAFELLDDEEMREAFKPFVQSLLEEIAMHEDHGGALAHVKHEILSFPEITYSWDINGDVLVVELTRREIDPETGEEALQLPVIVPFIPDTYDLPAEIRQDLIERLPIRNRRTLDN